MNVTRNSLMVLLLLSVVFILGCSSQDRSYSVKIVIPDGYRGLFKVKFDSSGAKQKWEGNTLVYVIPKSGTLVVQGENPFLKWGPFDIQQQDGKTIDCAYKMEKPPEDAILYRDIGGTNDGKEDWAVIGTEEEWKKANLELRHYQSNLDKSK